MYERQFPPSSFPTTPVPGQGGPQQGFPGIPGFPGIQLPGFPFSQPGWGGPGPGQGQGGPPTSPPPSTIPPQQQAQTYAVDPGSIRGCLYRYTYIRLRGFQSFWFYPTYVGRRSTSGYRWNGFRWVYFGVVLRRIQSFQCV